MLKSEPPVSGPATLRKLQQLLEDIHSLNAIAAIIRTSTAASDPASRLRQLEQQLADLELQHLDINSSIPSKLPALEHAARALSEAARRLGEELIEALSQRIPTQDATTNGLLLVNPLPFTRLLPLNWPAGWQPPAADKAIEATELKDNSCRLLAQLPPVASSGFANLPRSIPHNRPHFLPNVNRHSQNRSCSATNTLKSD
ncbi:MAG UNVERIFIED_CONTAM: hypothetical protein LVR18_06110 [Planctomycetaceae bacterium]